MYPNVLIVIRLTFNKLNGFTAKENKIPSNKWLEVCFSQTEYVTENHKLTEIIIWLQKGLRFINL